MAPTLERRIKMENKYVNAEIEVVEVNDIIVTSPNMGGESETPFLPASLSDYEATQTK